MGNISEIKNSQTNRQNTCAVTNKTKDLTKCLRPLNYKQLPNNQAVYMINQETFIHCSALIYYKEKILTNKKQKNNMLQKANGLNSKFREDSYNSLMAR